MSLSQALNQFAQNLGRYLHVFHTMNCRAMLCPYIRLHHCVAGQTRIPYVAGSYQWNIVSFEEEER